MIVADRPSLIPRGLGTTDYTTTYIPVTILQFVCFNQYPVQVLAWTGENILASLPTCNWLHRKVKGEAGRRGRQEGGGGEGLVHVYVIMCTMSRIDTTKPCTGSRCAERHDEQSH